MPVLATFGGSSTRNYGFTSSAQSEPAPAPVGDFESIATVTLSSAQSPVEFTSIPQTYTHLQIRGLVLTSANYTSDVKCNFNTDTGNNYSIHGIYGNGSSANAYSSLSPSYVVIGLQGQTSSPSPFVTDILDYRDTNKFKTIRSLAGADNNGSGSVYYHGGNWRSLSAITRITLTPYPSGNFNQYSSFALYGINA